MQARSIIAGIAVLFVVESNAHSHTAEECLEGGEFIRNAALSRDNGITREAFMSRLEDDLIAIKSFPTQLRWFVQDDLDEILLTSAVAQVFDTPQAPALHEKQFIDLCLQAPLESTEKGMVAPVPAALAMR